MIIGVLLFSSCAGSGGLNQSEAHQNLNATLQNVAALNAGIQAYNASLPEGDEGIQSKELDRAVTQANALSQALAAYEATLQPQEDVVVEPTK